MELLLMLPIKEPEEAEAVGEEVDFMAWQQVLEAKVVTV